MHPALYKAATQGDVATLKLLLEADPSILDSKTPQLNTALHLAALHGRADFAREVLAAKEDLLVARNADGDTPLHLAAVDGDLGVAELLARRAGSWPEDETQIRSPLLMTNDAGDTPLHVAAQNGKGAVALLLLSADPSHGHELNARGRSPLDMAAREGLVDVVERIVVNHQWVVVEAEPVRSTAMYEAVLGGHVRIVEILLEKRPQLMDVTDSDGNNALHYAAYADNARAVDVLLSEKMGIAYKSNHEQQSPLHVAAHYGSTAAIRVLLRQCPDVAEMVDGQGRNAFHASVVGGKTDGLRCLLRCVVRPKELLNRGDKEGNTPLHLAVRMSRAQPALLLVSDRRVVPYIRDRDGHTARRLVEINLTSGGETMGRHVMELWNELKRREPIRYREEPFPPVTVWRHISRGPVHEAIKQTSGIHVIIATLIATVTFAVTFTIPGGYDDSDGTPILGHSTAFKIFVLSDTAAMCFSIVVLLCLLRGWQDPDRLQIRLFLSVQSLNMLACLALFISLMTAIYATIEPIAPWVAYAVIVIGSSTVAIFSYLV